MSKIRLSEDKAMLASALQSGRNFDRRLKKKILLMFALLCATAQGAWAQNEWATVYTQTQTTADNWTALEASSTGRTLGTAGTTTYYYADASLTFSNSTAGGSGLTILGTVYFYVPEGVTLTCTGANADGQTGAGAGIELTSGNSLVLLGEGEVSATGGNARGVGDDDYFAGPFFYYA